MFTSTINRRGPTGRFCHPKEQVEALSWLCLGEEMRMEKRERTLRRMGKGASIHR